MQRQSTLTSSNLKQLKPPARRNRYGLENDCREVLGDESRAAIKQPFGMEAAVERTLACIESKPKPRTGQAVLERYKEMWFLGVMGEESGTQAGMEAGGDGRRRNLGDACAFLKWGV